MMTTTICKPCKGTGKVLFVPTVTVECKYCNGTGRRSAQPATQPDANAPIWHGQDNARWSHPAGDRCVECEGLKETTMNAEGRDDDRCAYVYEKAERFRCGGSREQHHRLGLSHDFINPTTPVRQTTPTQPTPDAGGEWCVVYDAEHRRADSYHIREWGNGDCIAHAATERHAAQIVADHRRVVKLETVLREILVEAEVSNVLWHQSRGFASTVQDAYDKGLMPPAYVRAKEVINAAPLSTTTGGSDD